MYCSHCGSEMEGDGYTTVIHCPNAVEEDYWYAEPDADPIYCSDSEPLLTE